MKEQTGKLKVPVVPRIMDAHSSVPVRGIMIIMPSCMDKDGMQHW